MGVCVGDSLPDSANTVHANIASTRPRLFPSFFRTPHIYPLYPFSVRTRHSAHGTRNHARTRTHTHRHTHTHIHTRRCPTTPPPSLPQNILRPDTHARTHTHGSVPLCGRVIQYVALGIAECEESKPHRNKIVDEPHMLCVL